MNILFLNGVPVTPYAGGVQRVTDVLGREFLRRGYNVIFIYIRNSLHCGQAISNSIYLPIIEAPIQAETMWREIILKNEVDVIINQECSEYSCKLLNCTPDGINKISCIHIQPFWEYGNERHIVRYMSPHSRFGFILKKFALYCPLVTYILRYIWVIRARTNYRGLISCSDKVCLLTSSLFKRMHRFLPNTLLEGKLCAINNPNTFESEFEVTEEKNNEILFVGRLENVTKNVVGFIRVWKELSVQLPQWSAYIVGTGEDEKNLRALVSQLKVQRLHFEGMRINVRDYYMRAKIIVITSISESWCMVMTEAMSMGCVPVVFDSFEAAAEIIDDGINGFLIEKFNYSMIVERVLMLVSDEKMRKEMSRKAKEKVEKYDVKFVVDEWVDLINSINSAK